MRFWIILACLGLAAGAAGAGERRVLGWSHVVTNDSIGQFDDRWQSSVVQGSLFLGPEGIDPAAARPGRVLEFRLSSQIITPENLTRPDPGDRLFAGALAAEVLTHGRVGAAEVSLGAGAVAVGPQTGTFRFQRWLHHILGYPPPATTGFEVEDGVYPVVSAEVGRSFGDRLRFRPFAEARAGVETLVRVGIDATWGALGHGDLMIREPVTGQRVPGIPGPGGGGVSWVAGADLAWVRESVYLPEARGYEVRPRGRLRAGVHWRGERAQVFYGLSYLGPEFEGQREGQVVGAVQVRVEF